MIPFLGFVVFGLAVPSVDGEYLSACQQLCNEYYKLILCTLRLPLQSKDIQNLHITS